ncbi:MULTISPECIES: hypothetical protein [unclassified Pseudomonas]|jgi:hypothetical protein|uniref:hypothetical protein n=1 Tax=unclassified Pseudomonas TaxID=196821 RepID=UPI000DA76C69|nr:MULTISPECIES: hypothetical protein [unclassified Pseudomonas]MDW3712905.1 hypothetical protein [Pseudomonas sp. 2023EL-01195]PZE12731.1 hypothetical protein DMX10_13955 [Pseudomonas sp. 57B-090624]
MAKTSQQRSADAAARRKERGEVELRHRVRPGILAMLRDLMNWGAISEIAECIQLLIMNIHALGPEGAKRFLAVPRHEITISESVARKLIQSGADEAARIDADEAA